MEKVQIEKIYDLCEKVMNQETKNIAFSPILYLHRFLNIKDSDKKTHQKLLLDALNLHENSPEVLLCEKLYEKYFADKEFALNSTWKIPFDIALRHKARFTTKSSIYLIDLMSHQAKFKMVKNDRIIAFSKEICDENILPVFLQNSSSFSNFSEEISIFFKVFEEFEKEIKLELPTFSVKFDKISDDFEDFSLKIDENGINTFYKHPQRTFRPQNIVEEVALDHPFVFSLLDEATKIPIFVFFIEEIGNKLI